MNGFFGEPVAVDGFPGISKLANPKGDEDALLFEINLITSDGLELPVDAMLDTGFSYWLAIDEQDLDALGWTYIDQQIMRTARRDVRFEIYMGRVNFDGQELDIPVHVGKGLTEVLLGRQ